MTGRRQPPWGIAAGPHIAHRWDCTKRGPYTETLVQRPTGQGVVIVRCEECNGDDGTDPGHPPEAA
jgi:hypothetical protein